MYGMYSVCWTRGNSLYDGSFGIHFRVGFVLEKLLVGPLIASFNGG